MFTGGVVLGAVLDELFDQFELRHLDVFVDFDGVIECTEVHRVHCVTDCYTHTHML